MLTTIELGKALQDGRYASMEDAEPFVEQLLRKMLGSAVHRFGELGAVSKGDLDILVAAKNARNYVAHEAAEPIVAGGLGTRLDDSMGRFRGEVTALAHGDGLVSRWSYAIQEKELALIDWSRSYPDAVGAWVLEPVVFGGGAG